MGQDQSSRVDCAVDQYLSYLPFGIIFYRPALCVVGRPPAEGRNLSREAGQDLEEEFPDWTSRYQNWPFHYEVDERAQVIIF